MNPQATPATPPTGNAPATPPPASAIPAAAPPASPSVVPGAQAAPPPAAPVSATPPATATPAAALPEGVVDWRATLPEELKNEKSLGHINSVEDLAKGYIHAQKAIGSKIAVPDFKLATPEDLKKFYHKIGLPEDIKDYKVDAAPESGLDPEFFGKFKEHAYKSGILPKQAQDLMNWYGEEAKTLAKAYQDQQKVAQDKEHNDLRNEWGKAHDQNVLAAQLIVKDFADPDVIQFLQETKLAEHPKILKLLSKIGMTLKEPEIRGSAGRSQVMKTPKEAQSEMNMIIGDMSHPYNVAGHPNHQAAVDEVAALSAMAVPPTQSENIF